MKKFKKNPKCKHFFEISDKWTDKDGVVWWEFYCKNCLEIIVRNQEKKEGNYG